VTDDQQNASRQTRFEQWYGMPLDENMDIQTRVAWENWCSAWDSAVDCLARSGNGYVVCVNRKAPRFGEI
jgi:hypothetical protein